MLAWRAGSWSFVTAVAHGKGSLCALGGGTREWSLMAASAGAVHAAFNVFPMDAFHCHQC